MIVISPFHPEHQQGVQDVVLTIQRHEFGIPITLEEQPDLMDIPGFCQRGKGNFWVALAGRKSSERSLSLISAKALACCARCS